MRMLREFELRTQIKMVHLVILLDFFLFKMFMKEGL